MRGLLAKIAAVLRSMGSFAFERVKEGGKWIYRLVQRPAEPLETMPQAEPAPDPVPETFDGLRKVAGILAQDHVPGAAELEGLPERTVQWLRAHNRGGLCKILAADDDQIRAHLRDRAPIRGLVPYDDRAIADVIEARRARIMRPERPTRRLIAEAMLAETYDHAPRPPADE